MSLIHPTAGQESPEPLATRAEAAAELPAGLPWWAFGLALILTALPVLLTSGLPSWDYGMHASRASVIVRQSLPLFQDAFHYKLVPLPNLAVDLVVPFLSHFMPISAANKLFVLLALLLQATGAAALMFAVQRRLTPAALLIPLACYNVIVGWGFTGYLFSIGIGLWGFACAVMLRERPFAVRCGALSLFAIVTYFGHLAAFGLMIVSIVLFEGVDFLRSRPRNKAVLGSELLSVALSIVVPGFVHVFLSPVGQSVGTTFMAPLYWLTDIIGVLNPYRTMGLAVLSLAVAAALAAMLLGRLVGLNRTLGWTSLLLLGVYLITPYELYGSWIANTRLIPWVALVFLASLRVSRPGRGAAWAVGACGLCLMAAQTVLILNLWLPWDHDRTELMAAARQAPPGTMFVALEQTNGQLPPRRSAIQRVSRAAWPDDPGWQPPTYHVTDEVAEQGEYLPIQLTLLPGKQPLEIDAKYWDLYLRFNSSYYSVIEPVNEARFIAMPETQRQRLMPVLSFAPLEVNPKSSAAVRRLLGFADEQYRAIRRASRVYPDAGVYVVYIHHRRPYSANPFPDILREVHAGRLYNVYELRTRALG